MSAYGGGHDAYGEYALCDVFYDSVFSHANDVYASYGCDGGDVLYGADDALLCDVFCVCDAHAAYDEIYDVCAYDVRDVYASYGLYDGGHVYDDGGGHETHDDGDETHVDHDYAKPSVRNMCFQDNPLFRAHVAQPSNQHEIHHACPQDP